MLTPGDVCVVEPTTPERLSGRFQTLVGKRVVVLDDPPVHDLVPVYVLDRTPECPWEYSIHLRVNQSDLRREE